MDKKKIKESLNRLVTTAIKWPVIKDNGGEFKIEHIDTTIDELFCTTENDASEEKKFESMQLLAKPYEGMLATLRSFVNKLDHEIASQYPHKTIDELKPYLEGRYPEQEAIFEKINEKNNKLKNVSFDSSEYLELNRQISALTEQQDALPKRADAMKNQINKIAGDDETFKSLLEQRCFIEEAREDIENIKAALPSLGNAIRRIRGYLDQNAPNVLINHEIELIEKRLLFVDKAIKLHTDYAFASSDYSSELKTLIRLDQEVSDQVQTILSGLRAGIRNIFPEAAPGQSLPSR
ncbi:MAG: hypothetical protein SFW63_00600 [Alphaproteobacteria bacterium]|nr:hypothetical protein [Alphaproteobacteria bacterium]